jgi:DNA-binding NarL/FixJ family response regulator
MGVLIMVADEPSLTEVFAGAKFDVALADLSFPVTSDKNVARLLHRMDPELKIIILSVHSEQTAVDECLAAGVKGFVLKRSASTDLLEAVEAVLKGGTYISPAIGLSQKKANRNAIKPH